MRQSLVFNTLQGSFEPLEGNKDESAKFDLFWKEAMTEGVWEHPTKGFKLPVTKERMEGWVDTFYKKQVPAGVQVPLPYGHTYTPEKNAGFIKNMEVRKKANGKHSLFTQLEVPRGEDSAKIGTTIKGVSVAIHPDLKRANGEGVDSFGECVEHVALTNYPVLTGMDDFVAFDSSEEAVAVVHMSIIDDVVPEDQKGLKLDASQLKKFAEILVAEHKKVFSSKEENAPSPTTTEEKDMKVTPEQLRATEKQFGLSENSLTEDNFFDAIGKIQFAMKKDDEEEAGAAGKGKGKKKDDELPFSQEPVKFDITKDPEFIRIQEQNKLLLDSVEQVRQDRMKTRLANISLRIKNCLTNGQMDKAQFDILLAGEKQEKLQFSTEGSKGVEFDSWLEKVEFGLSMAEARPKNEVVRTGERLNTLDPKTFDDPSEVAQKEMDEIEKFAQESIDLACPQNSAKNIKQDKAGLFFASIS